MTESDGFTPGRWWRVTTPNGAVWAETSNEVEARRIAADHPGYGLARLWTRTQSYWKPEDDPDAAVPSEAVARLDSRPDEPFRLKVSGPRKRRAHE